VTSYQFQAPYPPSVNRIWRRAGHVTYKTAEAKAYTAALQGGYFERYSAMPVLLQGAVKLTLNLYRPQKRGDIDNRIKVAMDSMNKFIYEDDVQVTELHIYRYDAPKKKGVKTMGWVDVTIEEIEG
jgi:Holliday junction resolvase RusA-like endonuclease